MKKILYVVNDITFFLSHRLHLALAARDAGFEVAVAAPQAPEASSILEQGLTFFPIPLHRWGAQPLREFSSLWALLKLYRRWRPDLVQQITIKPVLYGSFAARLARVPAVVNTISGMGQVFSAQGLWSSLRRKMVTGMYKLALSHPNSVALFQNPDDQQFFVASHLLPTTRACLIRGAGVDLNLFRPLPSSSAEVSILFPARLLVEKGIREFVAAARQLQSEGVKARFLVAGDIVQGNPGSITQADLEAWRAEGLCCFLGFHANMTQLLAQVQIVCLPSYYKEGIPKALIEAAACGKPIVTTDWPGCREIVDHETSGLLVAPRDVPALAQALQRLIEDASLRERMGLAGRRKVEQEGFSMQAVAGETMQLYRKLLEPVGLPV